MKELEAVVVREKEVEILTVPKVLANHKEEKGEITFPDLETFAGQLEAQFIQKGIIAEEINITNREEHKKAKDKRAFVNNVFKAYEDSRKEARRKDMEKHTAFLDESKKTVQKVCEDLSSEIDKKVREFEKTLIKELHTFAKTFLEKQLEDSPNKDLWDKLGEQEDLSITLQLNQGIGINTTEKQISDSVNEKIANYDKDFSFIKLQESSDRIVEEYIKNGYDVLSAVQTIQEEDRRAKALAEQMAEKLAEERLREAQEANQPAPTVTPPKPQINHTAPSMDVSGPTKELSPEVHVKIEMKGTRDMINYVLRIAKDNGIDLLGSEDMSVKEETEENPFF